MSPCIIYIYICFSLLNPKPCIAYSLILYYEQVRKRLLPQTCLGSRGCAYRLATPIQHPRSENVEASEPVAALKWMQRGPLFCVRPSDGRNLTPPKSGKGVYELFYYKVLEARSCETSRTRPSDMQGTPTPKP